MTRGNKEIPSLVKAESFAFQLRLPIGPRFFMNIDPLSVEVKSRLSFTLSVSSEF